MVCIDYNRENMGFVLYDNGEIELVEKNIDKNGNWDMIWHLNFRNIYDLAEAIKKAKPELATQLIEILQME